MADFSLSSLTGQPVLTPQFLNQTSYVATTALTNTTVTATYSKRPYEIKLRLQMAFTGTPGAATLAFSSYMPPGFTMDTSNPASDAFVCEGTWAAQDTGVQRYSGTAFITTAGALVLTRLDNSGPATTTNPFAFSTGDYITVEIIVPIVDANPYVAIGAGVSDTIPSLVAEGVSTSLTTTTPAGATTTPSLQVRQTRNGRQVNITIQTSGSLTKNGSVGQIVLTSVVDVDKRPTALIYHPFFTAQGLVLSAIGTDGTIQIYLNSGGSNIPAGQTNIGWGADNSITYSIR